MELRANNKMYVSMCKETWIYARIVLEHVEKITIRPCRQSVFSIMYIFICDGTHSKVSILFISIAICHLDGNSILTSKYARALQRKKKNY